MEGHIGRKAGVAAESRHLLVTWKPSLIRFHSDNSHRSRRPAVSVMDVTSLCPAAGLRRPGSITIQLHESPHPLKGWVMDGDRKHHDHKRGPGALSQQTAPSFHRHLTPQEHMNHFLPALVRNATVILYETKIFLPSALFYLLIPAGPPLLTPSNTIIQ